MNKIEYIAFLGTFLNKERVNSLIESINKEPYRCFHINPNKFIKIKNDSFELHPCIENAFYYKKELFDAGKTPYHHAGCYYIQDASAMMVGHLLNVKEDDRVLDMCAAPGGKTCFVAPLLKKGILYSNDVSYQRAKILQENVVRMGFDNVIVMSEEIQTLENKFEGYFDKIILDAPCSGEGMFRKNSLVEEDWSIDKVKKLVQIQKTLIISAYKMLKSGGELIYSTCTFNIYENEEIIKFLINSTEASLIAIEPIENVDRGIELKEAIRLFPDSFKGEGHFICKIKRCDSNESYIKPFKSNISKKSLSILGKFENENLNIKFDRSKLYERNNVIYYVPNNCTNLDNINVIQPGISIGEISGNNLKPSHNLGTFSNSIFKREISLDANSKEIEMYLHGDSFKIDSPNGYSQILVDGIPLGMCKVSNNMLKNLYPKALRKLG